MAKRKCSINDSIKSEYPLIKGMNENVECMSCNAKFCIAHGDHYHVPFFTKCPGFLGEMEMSHLKKKYYGNPNLDLCEN
jgi:hypothetical protein